MNKWDLVDKDTNTMAEKTAEIRRDLSYLTYAPIIFLSALTGQRVGKLYERINAVANQSAMRITTGMLNNILEDATARVQPPTDKGRRLKIYYMTQVGVKRRTLSSSATMHACSTSPTSAIWRISSAVSSVWRERPSG